MPSRSTATPTYDVVIMGGGPGGATLAALLARRTPLKVALYEQAIFPREHIGESAIARVTLLLERSGALPKVLASDCWLRKAGAFFDWDPAAAPYSLVFGHEAQKRDGIERWAVHVNRAEFDAILLDHAEASGVAVFRGTGVTAVEKREGGTRVRLEGGAAVDCRVFVDASGRQTSVLGVPRAYLSSYRNIAIWTHFVGGLPAQTLPGDWNLFREGDLSPVGSFACEDGWFWYIPVRKTVAGERVTTYSVGLVTDPAVLKHPGKQYTEMAAFMARCLEVPRLRELLAGARPLSTSLSTATNYSMISERLCSYDERWILLGDSAFFVDPLFSSGMALAVSEAFSAAFLIEATLCSPLAEAQQRDLWSDYHTRYRVAADTLAALIDQWYAAIGQIHPDSMYSKRQATSPGAGARAEGTSTLLDLSLLDAFLDFSIPAEQKDRWTTFFQSSGRATDSALFEAPGPRVRLQLREGVVVRPGAQLGTIPAEIPGEYWLDPVASGDRLVPLTPFVPCQRFCLGDRPDAATVPFVDRHDRGLLLYALLRRGPAPRGALEPSLAPAQRRLLERLIRADLVEVIA